MDKTQLYIIKQNALTNANAFWSKDDSRTEEKVLATAEMFSKWVIGEETSSVTEEDKRWLNFSTPQYNQAAEYMKGGGSIDELRKKYKISKKVADALAKL